MVGTTDLSTLTEEDPPSVRIEGQLIEPAGDGVRFDPYRGDSSGVQDVRSGY